MIQIFEAACLSVTFLANDAFQIALAYTQNGTFKETIIYQSFETGDIYLNAINATVPEMVADDQEFAIRLEFQAKSNGFVGALKSVIFFRRKCSDLGNHT